MALALVALLALLIVWAVNMGGDGGDKASQAGQDDQGEGAASSITPGPTSSESLDSQRPGGRDEAEVPEGTEGADDAGGTDGSDGVDETGAGSGDSDDSEGSEGSGGGADDAGGDVEGLSSCDPGQARIGLETVRDEYEPDQRPKLRLTVENTSGSACKVDVHPNSAVLTVLDSEDRTVWASDHCAPGGRTELRVPARKKTTHTVTWKRERSAASCATPPGGTPPAGDYVAEVELADDLGTARTEFVLKKA